MKKLKALLLITCCLFCMTCCLLQEKEAEIQEKRKKSRVGIAVASVIVIAAAVLIGLTMGKTEEIYTAAYAGNYERDSVEYHDYLDFLKENAVSEENNE